MKWLVYYGEEGGEASEDTLLNDGWAYHGLNTTMQADIKHIMRDLRSQGYCITGSFRRRTYEAVHRYKPKYIIEIFPL